MTLRHSTERRAHVLHRLFVVIVAVKGLDGVIDMIGGAILLLLPTGDIAAWAIAVTQHELSEDPSDFFASLLRRWGSEFGRGDQLFVAVYLLLHGVIKVLLAVSLLMGRSWAYPVAVAVLAAFMGYATYRLSLVWSWLIAVTILLDTAMMVLIVRERRIRARRGNEGGARGAGSS